MQGAPLSLFLSVSLSLFQHLEYKFLHLEYKRECIHLSCTHPSLSHTLSALLTLLALPLAACACTCAAQLAGLLVATSRLGLQPQAQWVGLVAEELQVQLLGMDMDTLADVWQSLGALGYRPAELWLRSFAGALAAALPAAGAGRAACRVVVDSARTGRGVPGGRAMLQALVQRVAPAPGGGGSSRLVAPDLPSPSRGVGASVGAALPAAASAAAAPAAGSGEGSGDGLAGLDARQVLLLIDALVVLQFDSTEALTRRFVAAAGQRRQS
jgi:hypothetical protein